MDIGRIDINASLDAVNTPANQKTTLDGLDGSLDGSLSQYDHGQIAVGLLDEWYPERPDDPVESIKYIVPELVNRTGMSHEVAHKHALEAFKVKGWS